jgi:hypothetical protein
MKVEITCNEMLEGAAPGTRYIGGPPLGQALRHRVSA